VSDNLGTTIAAAACLIVLAIGAGYLVSRRHGVRAPGPRVPTFARIGSFVGRRHRTIVIFWVLLLAVSLPLSQQLSQVITSSTSGGQSTTSQSAEAQALMAQEFPHPQANTSAIILLQGNDVTDKATKHFTLDLEQHLLNSSALNSVENVTTVYSLERTILTEGIQRLSPAIYSLETTTLGLNSLLYLVPLGFEQAWIQTNNTALTIYGIPAFYLAEWNSNGHDDAAANQTTMTYIDSIIASGTFDPNATSLLSLYYHHYYLSWTNETNISDPSVRIITAIKNAVGNTTASLSSQAQLEVLGIWQYFSLTTWNSSSSLNWYTQTTTEPVLGQQFGNTPFQPLYTSYFAYWMVAWNASFAGPSETPQARLSTILVPAFVSTAAGLATGLPTGKSIASLIDGISTTFDLANAANATLIHGFAIAQVKQGSLTTSFLEAVYALSPNPSYVAAQFLANQTLLSSTLLTYPLQIPSEILRNFISPSRDAMIILVDFSKSPGSFGSADTDPILKNVVTIRNVISQLKASDGGPTQT